MRLLDAELLASREILPGQWLQDYHAPWLAGGCRAGQFVHVRTPDYSGLVLRRPFSVNTVDRATGTFSIHFRITGQGSAWMARARPGEHLDMLGPLGRPFEVAPGTHHVLLIAGGLGVAGVRALADEALQAGRRVTMLFGAAGAAEVYPTSLLPDEVEYVVATEDGSVGHRGYVTDLVPDVEAWADQAFACGPQPMLAALARLARGRDTRLGVARLGRKRGRVPASSPPGSTQARRRAWLQVSMEQNMGCAVGACLGCVVHGVDGPVRVCREGPVFAADEIAWEPAS
jgi:dihydroorotate dehydrogenase electron transfer subunit